MKNTKYKIPPLVIALQIVMLYTVLLLTTPSVHAQSWQWAKTGGSSNDDTTGVNEGVQSMCTDNKGNVYVSSIISNGDSQIAGVTRPTFGTSDAIIASFSCEGNYRWSKSIGSINGGSNASYLGTDGVGNLYATSLTLASNNSSANELVHFDTDYTVPFDPTARKSMYLVKYSPQGDFLWLRYPEGPNSYYSSNNIGYSRGIEVDAQGNSYMLSELQPNTYGGTGGFVVSTTGIYILKYDSNGNFLGGVDLNVQYTGGLTIQMMRNPITGVFYICGMRNSSIVTVTIAGELVTHSLYIAAFSQTGDLLWKNENESHSTFPPSLEINAATNEVYLSGSATLLQEDTQDGFNGIPFISGLKPWPYIVTFDSTGNTVWQTNSHKGFADNVVVNGNEVAVVGTASNMQWQNLSYQDPSGSVSPYLARFNTTSGAILGIDGLPGTVTTQGSNKLATDTKGNYYLGGALASSITVNGTTTNSIGGNSDFFVAKFGTSDCNFLATEEQEQKNLRIYPNPVKDFLHIENSANSTYILYDVLGNVVAKGSVSENNPIALATIASGLYVLELLQDNGEKKVVKVLKE